MKSLLHLTSKYLDWGFTNGFDYLLAFQLHKLVGLTSGEPLMMEELRETVRNLPGEEE